MDDANDREDGKLRNHGRRTNCDDELLPDIETVCPDISDFTVGLARLSAQNGAEDAAPVGSGALVSIGRIKGILTAAHVLDTLPDSGEIGLIQFPRVQRHARKTTIDAELTEKLAIEARPYGPDGPDIGFLRLYGRNIGLLETQNVFFNLGKRRDGVLSNSFPKLPYYDGISGVVAQWTTDLPDEGNRRVRLFRALFGVGSVEEKRDFGGFDLMHFEVSYGEGSSAPDSFEGMSGGALWRVFCSRSVDGELMASEKMIVGVAFHQSDVVDAERIVFCHGPKSVYGRLVDAVRAKWPD